MKDTLEHWKELSRTVTLEELVRTLVYDTGYYDYCSSLPAGRQRTSNLQLLIDRAAAFEQSDYTGLYGFLSYVEAMDRNRLTADEAKITGITPAVLTFIGIWEDCPPTILRPCIFFAY